MKKYFLHNGTEQQGPFDIDELRARHIQKDTPIWYEGLGEWTTAGTIDELKELFKIVTPPPFQNQKSTDTKSSEQPSKKSSSVPILLKVVITLLVIAAVYMVLTKIDVSGGSGDVFGGDTYEEKVMTVEEIERSQPTKFLSAGGEYRQTILGNKFKVDCTITNSATVATYKDAVVRVTYYSKTKTVLGTNDYTIYESFPPHSSKTTRLKIDNYKDVETIGWDVVEAQAF